MWNITNKFLGKLPEGFLLYENEDFLYLCLKSKEQIIYVFYKNATAEEIEKIAKDYLQKIQRKS